MKAIKDKQDKSSDSKFIEKIKFEEDFPPFAQGQEIEFGGENQIQDLIEFYLKSKGINNYKKNAERFKINCLLGSNGGGKSRLLHLFYNYCEQSNYRFDSNTLGVQIDRKDICIFDKQIEYYNLVLDDFYKFSPINEKSVNFDFINKENINFAYLSIYSFLLKNKNNFLSYLNLEPNYRISLELNFAKDFIHESKWYFLNKDSMNLKEYYLSNSEQKQFFEVLKYFYEILIGKKDKGNLLENFSDDDIYNFLFANLDLILLLVEYLRGDIVEQHQTVNKETQGFKDFYDLLEIIEFLFIYIQENDIFKYIDYSDEYSKELNIFRNNFPEYLKKIKTFKECFDFYINNEEEKATKTFRNNFGKPKIGDTFEQFLFWETGYEYVNHSGDHENLLKKFIFINKYEKLGVSIFIGDIKFFYSKKIGDRKIIILGEDLNHDEKIILNAKHFFNLDIKVSDNTRTKYLHDLSSGELINLIRTTNIFTRLKEDNHHSNIVLIDEPDLHLHLDWQRKYIQKLIDVFSTLPEEINIHFIIATHSPFIISDLPGECIVKLQGDGKGNTEISYLKDSEKTFGANYIDLIEDGFFFEDKNLMGSFSENIIGGLAEEERKKFFNGETNYNTLKQNIGDDFLKQNLAYFYKKDNEEN